MTKKIYLGGAIKDLSTKEASNWRQKAKKKLEIVEILESKDKVVQEYGMGDGTAPVQLFECLNPMRRNFRDTEFQSQNEIVALDKVDILNSDILLVNATKPSWGTAMEIMFAFQHHKIIVTFTGGEFGLTNPWVAFHSTRVTNTLEEAIDYIKKHFSNE